MYKKGIKTLGVMSTLAFLITGSSLMSAQAISQQICMCGISDGQGTHCEEAGTGCGTIDLPIDQCITMCQNLASKLKGPNIKSKTWNGTNLASLRSTCEKWRECPHTGKTKVFKK